MYKRPVWLVLNILTFCLFVATLVFICQEAKHYCNGGDEWSGIFYLNEMKQWWNFIGKQ